MNTIPPHVPLVRDVQEGALIRAPSSLLSYFGGRVEYFPEHLSGPTQGLSTESIGYDINSSYPHSLVDIEDLWIITESERHRPSNEQ
jgi:hypothetical protein